MSGPIEYFHSFWQSWRLIHGLLSVILCGKKDDMEVVDFRKKLAFALIRNQYYKEEVKECERKKRRFQG